MVASHLRKAHVAQVYDTPPSDRTRRTTPGGACRASRPTQPRCPKGHPGSLANMLDEGTVGTHLNNSGNNTEGTVTSVATMIALRSVSLNVDPNACGWDRR